MTKDDKIKKSDEEVSKKVEKDYTEKVPGHPEGELDYMNPEK